jgi:hypothetical protein
MRKDESMIRMRKQGDTSSAVEAASGRGPVAATLIEAVETGAPGEFNRGAASAASAATGGDAQAVSITAQVWLPASPDREAQM